MPTIEINDQRQIIVSFFSDLGEAERKGEDSISHFFHKAPTGMPGNKLRFIEFKVQELHKERKTSFIFIYKNVPSKTLKLPCSHKSIEKLGCKDYFLAITNLSQLYISSLKPQKFA